MILFYAQTLDRPAFRTRFHEELSFTDFDQAMEDTLLALNTGYWRTRDGAVLLRSKGKVNLINVDWRQKIEDIAVSIEKIRRHLRQAVGLNEMLFQIGRRNRYFAEDIFESRFRGDFNLSDQMDSERQAIFDNINPILEEIGQQPLHGIRD